MRLGRDVHGVVGATLSARAVTESVRRVLALYNVLVASVDSPAPIVERSAPDPPAVDQTTIDQATIDQATIDQAKGQ
jgi:hypothetical protein